MSPIQFFVFRSLTEILTDIFFWSQRRQGAVCSSNCEGQNTSDHAVKSFHFSNWSHFLLLNSSTFLASLKFYNDQQVQLPKFYTIYRHLKGGKFSVGSRKSMNFFGAFVWLVWRLPVHSSAMAATQSVTNANDAANSEENNIWSQLLAVAAKKQTTPPKHLIMLGKWTRIHRFSPKSIVALPKSY